MFINFASLFSVDILVKISAYLLLPVYLNLMTQEEFGVYNYLLSFVITLSGLLYFGQNIAQSKLYFDGSNEKEKGEILFSISVIWFILFLMTFIFILLTGFDKQLANVLFNNSFDYGMFRYIILAAIPITIINGMLFNFLVISKQIRKIQYLNLIKLLSINILSIWALYYIEFEHVKLRLFFTYSAELLVLLLFIKYFIDSFNFNFNKKIAVKAIKIGIPITIASIPLLSISIVDKYFINKYFGISDLSVFYLAFTISTAIPMVFYSFNNILSPEIFKEKDLAKNLRKTFKIMLFMELMLTAIALGLWISIYALLKTNLITGNYGQALQLLPILFAGQLITNITAVLSIYMVYFEKTYYHTIFGFALFVPSLAISYFLTFNLGNTGAAFAFLINAIMNVLVFGSVVHRIIKAKQHLLKLTT